MAERACEVCGQPYRPIKKWQRFCPPACRNTFHNEKRTVDILAQRVKMLEDRVAYLEQLATPVR